MTAHEILYGAWYSKSVLSFLFDVNIWWTVVGQVQFVMVIDYKCDFKDCTKLSFLCWILWTWMKLWGCVLTSLTQWKYLLLKILHTAGSALHFNKLEIIFSCTASHLLVVNQMQHHDTNSHVSFIWTMFVARQGKRRSCPSCLAAVQILTAIQCSSLSWNCSGASSN